MDADLIPPPSRELLTVRQVVKRFPMIGEPLLRELIRRQEIAYVPIRGVKRTTLRVSPQAIEDWLRRQEVAPKPSR